MKKLFLSLALSLFAFAANAATLTENFVASNGQVFQIHSVLSVEKGAGVIYVKQATGSIHPFADATGAVWTKVLNSANFSQHYIRVGTTDRYMNTTVITEISCVSSQTVFGYYSASQPEWFQDGCALHTAVRNASN